MAHGVVDGADEERLGAVVAAAACERERRGHRREDAHQRTVKAVLSRTIGAAGLTPWVRLTVSR